LVITAGLLIGAGLAIFVYFGLNFSGTKPVPDDEIQGVSLPESAAVGAAAPDFDLNKLNGENIKLNDLRGKIVVINFWATWCEPCKIEMPFFESLYLAQNPKLEILAVNFDEPPQQVQQFVDDFGISFPVLLDPGAEVQKLYRVRGYPTTFVVDEKGVISFHHIGLITEEQLSHYLTELGVSE
jgi:peroxiredoxin